MPNENRQLQAHPKASAPPGPVVLVIMDGVGVGNEDAFDAVHSARTPTLDRLRTDSLYRTLLAHGTAVGLPTDADMGNSEVGHNILGAGRIFDQGAKSIEKALESGTIWQGVWAELIAHTQAASSCLHFVGLMSDGGVHSNMKHLFALIDQAHSEGVSKVRLHLLSDGRDVPDHSAHEYLAQIEAHLAAINTDSTRDYRIASGGGRMLTTMDRYEADWRIVERGWHAHVLGRGRGFTSALEAIKTQRAEQAGISDQGLPAYIVVDAEQQPVGTIDDGDTVVLFNFRGDRALQICQAFSAGDEFSGFERHRVPEVYFAGMMLYDGDLNIPQKYLVAPETVTDTVSEYIARAGLSQFACAETQKYGHVTFFWNGNRSDKFDSNTETYLEIPSDRVPFEERPWMKSAETADAVIDAIRGGKQRFIRTNFAGGDMVGHTGAFAAAVLAVESVDLALARILPEVEAAGGCIVITADHGNADDMVERDKSGAPLFNEAGQPRARTSHSLNRVPVYIKDYSARTASLRSDINQAGLSNIASTLIELLGYSAPGEYEPTLLKWS
jgi:2,3-bisphosphoglycerate-independent phosphoglycerate mutase